jgi:pantoate--beta-alanine ligase
MEILKTVVCTSVESLTNALQPARLAGKKIGFVPTMGALHNGHLSLIQQSNQENDLTVASIFINPTQFNDPSDFANYPRMESKDLEMLESAGCDFAFIPSVPEIYPNGKQLLDIHFGALEETMEGAFRPGHFRGIATVVNRLLSIVNPDNAYFGEKDFQQLAVIRAMVKMLDLKVKVTGCPTLREADGLAMSSRNLLLTPEQRKAAALIYQGLQQASTFIPHHSVDGVRDLVIRFIEQSPLLKVQYFKIVDPLTLADIRSWEGQTSAQGCIAVLTEGPRLIDNIHYSL